MHIVISPSKSQNFESKAPYSFHSIPDFANDSQRLLKELRKLDAEGIGKLMRVSEKIAALNEQRFRSFRLPFTLENAKQALFAFTGDVYTGFDLDKYSKEDLQYAQEHLSILSGFYGLLRPMDLIQPYRLEMKTPLKNPSGKDLYTFWGSKLNTALQKFLDFEKNPILVNLASNEYSKALQLKKLNARVVTPVFKDNKNGTYKVIAFYAKKARGMMADYLIRNRIDTLEELKCFSKNGYLFNSAMSKENELVFTKG